MTKKLNQTLFTSNEAKALQNKVKKPRKKAVRIVTAPTANLAQKTAKIYVGIDPSFRQSGYALCCIDTSDNSVSFKTFKNGFNDFCSWVRNDAPIQSDCIICVENSNLQNESFDLTGSLVMVARKSRNVGKNQAVSQNSVDLLRANGYLVVDLSPKEKGKKYTALEFAAVAKSEKHTVSKQTSQDEKDAYKMALLARQKSYLAK